MLLRKTGETVAQITPQRVGQAFIAALAAAFTLTTGGIYRFVNGANHFANGDAAGILPNR
ncbi:Uncharacterised protein [Escherichia coli]|uniref:Uncharacterized protein n=1 Tax=Escherichia coli TaxID=562 RepID=A0A376U6S2_ECOLX|nr:Uncharacterised protein [Escherichia coli]